jgi:hypothetical protein
MSTFSNPLTEYSPQQEMSDFLETKYADGSRNGVFTETAEMELAAALLEVRDEAELDHFIGNLLSAAGSALGKVIGAPAVRAIGGVLKKVARTALPVAGGVLGGVYGGPLGAQLGSALASRAGQVLGLELEGLSPEDREFEATRQFVRFAGATVLKALEAGDPARTAHRAARDAARVYAPGLMDAAYSRASAGAGSAGAAGPFSWESENATSGGHAMHDIDRTQVGFGREMENPYDREQPTSQYEYDQEQPPSQYEIEEMELVNALMEVQTEEEFESFLSGLLSRAVNAVGGWLSTPTGKALGGLLKGAAQRILPVVQQVAGSGGESGEFETNGGPMSEAEMDELEFEAAQTFVRLAQEAAANAANAAPDADPAATARQAVTDAARVHAPDLVASPGQMPRQPAGPSFAGPHSCLCKGRRRYAGNWVRRGNKIILMGA